MLNFVKGFLCIYWDNHMVFIFQFGNVVYYIYWFVYIEESLHPWDKAHLVMMYDLFKTSLGMLLSLGNSSSVQFSSVQSLSRAQLWLLRLYRLQHARLPCPSPTLRACSNSCPLSPWWYPSISSSVIPFSSCLQSFPTSGSFPISQFFTSGGQSIEVSASASVLSVNIQDWFPLELNSSWGLYILVPCCFKREQNTLKKYMV